MRPARDHEGLRSHAERVCALPDVDTERRRPPDELARHACRIGNSVLAADRRSEHVVRVQTVDLAGVDTFDGNTKLGLQFETVVDRTKFGLNWNAPLPKGGFMLANDVTLSVDLELAQA